MPPGYAVGCKSALPPDPSLATSLSHLITSDRLAQSGCPLHRLAVHTPLSPHTGRDSQSYLNDKMITDYNTGISPTQECTGLLALVNRSMNGAAITLPICPSNILYARTMHYIPQHLY